jgi:hypothetical protein
MNFSYYGMNWFDNKYFKLITAHSSKVGQRNLICIY